MLHLAESGCGKENKVWRDGGSISAACGILAWGGFKKIK